MYQLSKLQIIVSIIVCFLLQAQCADKYTDENRPYEFGFKIDGQQHRHEKKDKDGIIMGEFGFITADDVYHVTVYATDKDGHFKILSMKNIHLKSSPATSSRQGHSLALPPSPGPSVKVPSPPAPVSQSRMPFEPVSLEPPTKSCSSCSIPTTTKVPPPAPVSSQPNYNTPGQSGFGAPSQRGPVPALQGFGGQQNYPNQQKAYEPNSQINSQQKPNSVPIYSQQNQQQYYPNQQQHNSAGPVIGQGPYPPNYYVANEGNPGQNYPQQDSIAPNYPSEVGGSQSSYPEPQNNAAGGQSGFAIPNGYAPQSGSIGQSFPEQNSQNYPKQNAQSQGGEPNPNTQYPKQNPSVQEPNSSGRSPKQYSGPEQQFGSNAGPNYPQAGPNYDQYRPSQEPPRGPAKPTLVSAQMQIVDKNTNIHHLNPGENQGLPAGLSKHDMVRLLYTFNYTLGFQGHFEEGYTNGVKKGYYFVTGRNGVRMRVDYVADDTGFHPKISQDVLDLLSDEVPKPETERDAKYGLKGYEFKWLYYPVDSKRR